MPSNNVTEAENVEPYEAVAPKSLDGWGIDELVGRAQAEGLQVAGEGGLLQQVAKRLLESLSRGESPDHLAYDRHDRAGKNGGNSRNGTRAKTVLTESAGTPGTSGLLHPHSCRCAMHEALNAEVEVIPPTSSVRSAA
ncbi:transposase [Streptomyces sp. NPDC059171]|uniref:transposase n=1 Tax=unclassified Streptomyces TaxID=2593676 RepID=UPI00368A718D